MSELGKALSDAARGPGSGDAAQRLLARAAAEGLVDVAYALVGSPFGDLLVASTPRGLVRIGFLGAEDDEREPSFDEDAMLEELAGRLSPRVLESPQRLDRERRQLDEYFAGRRRRFDLDLDWRLTRGFNRRVLRATARIPYGDTSTYAGVAAEAGNRRASRAAGNALHRNPIPIVVPCHRVLRSGGEVGGYGGGPQMKQSLLRMEGAL